MNDLRFALRQLLRNPGLTTVVAISLGIGIGANATVLCWIRNILWRPLPGVARQEDLAVVVSSQGSGCVSLPDLRDLVQENPAFAGGLASMVTSASLTVDRDSEWVEAQIVGANFFDLLGVLLGWESPFIIQQIEKFFFVGSGNGLHVFGYLPARSPHGEYQT